jgi:membrane-associated protein
MDLIGLVKYFIDFFLHLDKHLDQIIQSYGTLTYVFLFLIVFCETGLVVTPILPGDSLLFAAGTFAGLGSLNVWWLYFSLTLAAVLGDTVNYSIGHFLGAQAFEKYPRIFKKQYLDRTHAFFERYGGKTIIIARFVPIVRTFAPFVAGAGRMTYLKFISYNIIGGVAWPAVCIFSGYFFGNIPIVKNNFTLVIQAIIFISILPTIIEYLRQRYSKKV